MKWFSFGIAFSLCVIIPVWVLDFVDIGIIKKLIFTVVGGVAVWYFVENGGAKRGLISKR